MARFELILHVGMPRSAAVLRPGLGRLRPQLHRHGVAFVGPKMILDSLEPGARAGTGRTATDGAVVADKVLALAAEQAGRTSTPATAVIVSSELLLPGSTPTAQGQVELTSTGTLARIAGAAAGHPVRVVLYPERQDRLLEVAYTQAVLNGVEVPPETFFDREVRHLDYVALVDRLASLDGVDDVVVRPAELADAGGLAFVNDFLGLVGLRDQLDLYAIGADLPAHQQVCSRQGVELARAMMPLLDDPHDLDLVRTFLTDTYSTGELNITDVLDTDLRTALLRSYAEVNRGLFERFMPDLPADSYLDDTATFALGNVLAQPPRSGSGAPGNTASTSVTERAGQLARAVCGRLARWQRSR